MVNSSLENYSLNCAKHIQLQLTKDQFPALNLLGPICARMNARERFRNLFSSMKKKLMRKSSLISRKLTA